MPRTQASRTKSLEAGDQLGWDMLDTGVNSPQLTHKQLATASRLPSSSRLRVPGGLPTFS